MTCFTIASQVTTLEWEGTTTAAAATTKTIICSMIVYIYE